jgi:hypothetical protein
MLYTLLTLGATILFLTFVTSHIILRAAVSERPLRKLMTLLVIMVPPITIFAFVKGLFCRPKPVPYNQELGRIEDEIESERATTFGGKIIRPSFSERWKVSYLYAVEKGAAAAVRLDPDLDHSLCGISHFH